MNYGYLYYTLISKGFIFESVQTGANFDDISFSHPTIKGEIFVSLDPNYEIVDGTFIDYKNSEWVKNVKVEAIHFEMEMGISFQDLQYPQFEDSIMLLADDLYLFDRVVDLYVNNYTYLTFQREYSKEIQKFLRKIERLIPFIEECGLRHSARFPINGTENTLYKSMCFEYGFDHFNSINFIFSVLDWKHKVYYGFGGEFLEIDFSSSIRIIKKELKKQVEKYERISSNF